MHSTHILFVNTYVQTDFILIKDCPTFLLLNDFIMKGK